MKSIVEIESVRILLSTNLVLLVCMCVSREEMGGFLKCFLYVQMSNQGVRYAFTASNIYLLLIARKL